MKGEEEKGNEKEKEEEEEKKMKKTSQIFSAIMRTGYNTNSV